MSETSTLPVEKLKDEFPDELPAKKLCNQSPPFNPIQGDGPLGNRFSGKMSYIASDVGQLVKTVQMMLNDLGITDDDENSLEPDGDFGNKTEQALKKFQKDNKDWQLKDLKTDGLVGPQTADALNRAMVGIWYKVYETDKELTDGQTFITVMSERFTDGLTVILNSSELASSSDPSQEQTTSKRRDDGRAAFVHLPPTIKPQIFEVQILDQKQKKFKKPVSFEVENSEQNTDDESILRLRNKRSQISLIGTIGEEGAQEGKEGAQEGKEGAQEGKEGGLIIVGGECQESEHVYSLMDDGRVIDNNTWEEVDIAEVFEGSIETDSAIA